MNSDKKKNIFETINEIMKEVPAIKKNKKNEKQNYRFRGIDDVMNALQPLFAKYKLFIVPELLEQIREERKTANGGNLLYSICKIKYTFYAEDGSNIESIVIGEGMDSGDKASNKAMATALKYALFQVFCIPTEEMKDGDKEKPPLTISNKEMLKLMADFKELLIATETIPEEVYEHFKVKNDTEMTPEQFIEAIKILKYKYSQKTKMVKKEVF